MHVLKLEQIKIIAYFQIKEKKRHYILDIRIQNNIISINLVFLLIF